MIYLFRSSFNHIYPYYNQNFQDTTFFFKAHNKYLRNFRYGSRSPNTWIKIRHLIKLFSLVRKRRKLSGILELFFYQFLPSEGVWKHLSKGFLSKSHSVADGNKSSDILRGFSIIFFLPYLEELYIFCYEILYEIMHLAHTFKFYGILPMVWILLQIQIMWLSRFVNYACKLSSVTDTDTEIRHGR